MDSLEQRILGLCKDIDSAKVSLTICAGELDPAVYNDDRVLMSTLNAMARGVNIKVMYGPVLAVDDNGQNKFFKLNLSSEDIYKKFSIAPAVNLLNVFRNSKLCFGFRNCFFKTTSEHTKPIPTLNRFLRFFTIW